MDGAERRDDARASRRRLMRRRFEKRDDETTIPSVDGGSRGHESTSRPARSTRRSFLRRGPIPRRPDPREPRPRAVHPFAQRGRHAPVRPHPLRRRPRPARTESAPVFSTAVSMSEINLAASTHVRRGHGSIPSATLLARLAHSAGRTEGTRDGHGRLVPPPPVLTRRSTSSASASSRDLTAPIRHSCAGVRPPRSRTATGWGRRGVRGLAKWVTGVALCRTPSNNASTTATTPPPPPPKRRGASRCVPCRPRRPSSRPVAGAFARTRASPRAHASMSGVRPRASARRDRRRRRLDF